MNAPANHEQKQEPAKGASSKACVLFKLGRVIVTPAAVEVMKAGNVDFIALLARHVSGDWGNVCPDDAQSNREAVETSARIISVYPVGMQDIHVRTEADRSVTTLLIPSDY